MCLIVAFGPRWVMLTWQPWALWLGTAGTQGLNIYVFGNALSTMLSADSFKAPLLSSLDFASGLLPLEPKG